jgi:hypothetical protein
MFKTAFEALSILNLIALVLINLRKDGMQFWNIFYMDLIAGAWLSLLLCIIYFTFLLFLSIPDSLWHIFNNLKNNKKDE